MFCDYTFLYLTKNLAFKALSYGFFLQLILTYFAAFTVLFYILYDIIK